MSLKKNLEIERLRGLAVLMVLNAHLTFKLLPEPYFNNGWPGVDLFFVISGFVITNSLLILFKDNSTKTALKIFFTRRVFRILPLVLLWVLIPLLLSLFFNSQNSFGSTSDLLTEAISILRLTYNYDLAHGGPAYLAYYWSIMVEEHFYLLLPLAFVFFKSYKSRMIFVVLGILLVAGVLRPFTPGDSTSGMLHLSHKKFDALFAGVLLALLRTRAWGESFKKPSPAIVTPLAVIPLLFIWTAPLLMGQEMAFHNGMVFIWLCAFILVFLASLNRNFIFGIPGIAPFLEYVGSRSFGIYLANFPLNSFFNELRFCFKDRLPHSLLDNSLLYYFGYIPLLFVVVELIYRFIEAPMISKGREISERTAERN